MSVIEEARPIYEKIVKKKENPIWDIKSIDPYFKCKSP